MIDFTKAIKIDPKDVSAYVNLGIVYCRKGDYEKAWEDVHRAEDLGHQVQPAFLRDLREASRREMTEPLSTILRQLTNAP